MPSVTANLMAEGALVLYHDYRQGHCNDMSGQGNDGTITDAVWASDGLQFPLITSNVVVADAAELQLTEGTIVVLGRFFDQRSGAYLVSKRDGGGTNYEYKIGTSSQMYFYDGASNRLINANVIANRYVAANFKNAEICEEFHEGISVGSYNDVSAISTDDAPLYIGNRWSGSYNALGCTIQAVLIVNRKLTATEHAQLYNELMLTKFPSKTTARAEPSLGPELLTDGDMETAGTAAWTAGASATLTKETNNVLGGSQVLRVARNGVDYPYAKQVILTVGTKYRATGWARGDGGNCSPGIASELSYEKLWQGSNSTSWQYFDVTFTSIGTGFRLQNYTTNPGWTEFDNVTVKQVYDDETQFKTDWNTQIVANLAPGDTVPNTPLTVSSGAYKVTTETIDGETCKVVECTNAGILAMYVSEIVGDGDQDAYGTWEMYFNKASGSSIYFSFVMNAGASAGYFVLLNNTEQVILYEIPAGTTHFATVASYFTDSTWHKLRVTRRHSDGQMTVYLNDTLVDPTGGSGTNPASDTTHTTSEVLAFDLDAGDKIAIADMAGDHCLRKLHGVVAP